MPLTSLLWCLLASALSVALLAFGWMPCPACCTVTLSCCPFAGPFPTTLYVTVQPKTSLGANIGSPVSWPLVYDPATSKWRGSGTIPQCTDSTDVTYEFYCVGGTASELRFNWICSGGGGGVSGNSYIGTSCFPFLASGAIATVNSCSSTCVQYQHDVTK